MSNVREFFHEYFPIGFGEYSVKITYKEDVDDIVIRACEFDLDDGFRGMLDEDCLDNLKPELVKELKKDEGSCYG